MHILAILATVLALDGTWNLQYWPQPDSGAIRTLDVPADAKRVDATVPGNCELDLVKAGLLPTPEVGLNARALWPYEGYQWLYTKTFAKPAVAKGERAMLRFEGIDTLADIFLNGEKIGETSNMLIPHAFDVTKRLRDGANALQVLLRSVRCEAQYRTLGELGYSMGGGADGEPFRKAGHAGGWDIFPRIYCAGLWRSVALDVEKPVRIDQTAWIVRDLGKDWVNLNVHCRVQAPFRVLDNAELRLTLARGGKTVSVRVEPLDRYQNCAAHWRIDGIERWWPKGMGGQPLYDAKIEVVSKKGAVLAEHAEKIGLRTIRLERDDVYSKERPGQFLFRVNGEPCYVRGSNWVPLDAFHGRDGRFLRPTLEMFDDLNCNMVRVWGGGVYEPDEFFDFCDAHGIMVWQDFMTGCSVFPQGDDYAKATEEEIRAIVLKYRNRASLALWSGNNENDIAFSWKLSRGLRRDPNKDRTSRRTIPDVLYEFDVTRDYLPSSPYESTDVFWGRAQPSELHLWGARAYYKVPFYTNSPAWFASEMGYHGCPNLETLRRMMTPGNLYPWKKITGADPKTDYVWNDEWCFKASDSRIGDFGQCRNSLMTNQIRLMFGGVDTNLETFIEQSQFVQAEAMKTFCELFRSRKFTRFNGLIWWNVRDGWPQLSDAVVDYYGGKKRAYYALKNAQQDQIVCVTDDHSLWAINDARREVKGTVRVTDAATGKVLLDEAFAIPANGKVRVATVPFEGQGVLWLDATFDGRAYRNHFLYGEAPFDWKKIRLWLASGERNPVIPFLAVTGKPTDAELARKVAAFKADGYDSFLIYARSGLQYRYLGEEWLHAVDTLCAEADKNGLKVWLYDEYNWPSGTCKGRVPNENVKCRYSEWAVYRNQDGTFRWQNVFAPAGWVNVLDEGAMKRFIELTHDVYAKRLKKWFDRKLIQGIFTDEPGHPTTIRFEGKPLRHFARWDGLEEEYRAETGRDFRADVEANLAGKGPAAVWETYASLQGRRFRKNYFGRIDEWCRKAGILSTGHMIAEDDVCGSCRFNGDPLVALKGESLPGMDEIGSRPHAHGEWVTLSVAQHAATHNGRGGLVELYALGPNDLTPAHLRQMIWLEALFGVDHYLVSMEVMDHKGLVEKHGYLSPMQEGQSWHGVKKPLFDEAKRAARFARQLDYVRTAAVRYPQKAAARCAHADGKKPELKTLLGEINRAQMTSDLIEENEKTDLPFVFTVDGRSVREERTGETFASGAAAAEWLLGRVSPKIRYFEKDGSVARDLLLRVYGDGSSVALDVRNKGSRELVAEIGGGRHPCRIPARGVLVLKPGELPQAPDDPATRAWTAPEKDFAYTLDRANLMRLFLSTNRVARFTLAEPQKGLRLVLRECAISYAVTASGRPVDEFEAPPEKEKVLRHDAVPYSFELDGRPVSGIRTASALPIEFNPLYRETDALDLAAGEHVLRLVTGEDDVNYFLPAAFVAGAFAVDDQTIRPLPKRLRFGSLAEQGLGTYAGQLTYRLEGVRPVSDVLRLDTGNVFTQVKWNGRDLGVRGWAPCDWKLPSAEPGTLEVTVFTPVVSIFGDKDRPGSFWDFHFWCSPRDPESTPGLYGTSGCAKNQ